MIRKLQWSSVLFIVLISILSCNSDKNQGPKPVQEIQVVKVIQKDVPLYSYYVGQIYGEKDIPIRARVEGFLESIDFSEGKKVSEGQLLYTIDAQPFVAEVNAQQSKVAEAQTMLVKAKADLDRIKPLAKLKAVSESDLDAATAQYEAAQSSLQAAQANVRSAEINLSYTQIKSPIDGIIGITKAKVGEFVGRDPNPVILNMVSQTNNIIVKFYITEKEYLLLARTFDDADKVEKRAENKATGNQPLELILSDGSIYNHRGHFDAIDAQVDPNTGSILVQAIFPNPEGLLKPGMYSKIKAEMNISKGALLIPQRCLTELQGQYSAFAINDSNQVITRQLKISHKIGDMCIVSDGLKIGDRIVIDGIQKVADNVTIKPIEIEFKSENQ